MKGVRQNLALWRRHLASLAQRACSRLEVSIVDRLKLELKCPPLFIVGAPRCGTTLPYLYLLERFGFGYFPNLAKELDATPILAGLLAHHLAPHTSSYESRYGQVRGRSAPSDGWEIFHRWFPRYDLHRPVQRQRLHELRAIVAAYERIYSAPFINKNNHNSVRIRELNALFPDALFIHVTRDVVDASLSLLQARQFHDVELGDWWSCVPPQYLDRAFDSQVEQAVYTIVGVRQHVEQRLAALDSNRWLQLAYEDFCRQPEALVDWVRSRYDCGLLRERANFDAPEFEPRSKATAATAELEQEIGRICQQLFVEADDDRRIR